MSEAGCRRADLHNLRLAGRIVGQWKVRKGTFISTSRVCAFLRICIQCSLFNAVAKSIDGYSR